MAGKEEAEPFVPTKAEKAVIKLILSGVKARPAFLKCGLNYGSRFWRYRRVTRRAVYNHWQPEHPKVCHTPRQVFSRANDTPRQVFTQHQAS